MPLDVLLIWIIGHAVGVCVFGALAMLLLALSGTVFLMFIAPWFDLCAIDEE